MKNKKILGLVVGVILIFAIMPYFIGNMAKKNVAELAEEISQIPGYSLKIQTYDQGWFSSRAVVSYGFDEHTLNILGASIDEQEELDKDVYDFLKKGFIFDIAIAHGPVTFQNGVNFALMSLSGTLQDIDHPEYYAIKENNNLISLLDIFASVSYLGNINFKASVPAFKADNASKIAEDEASKHVSINFKGMNFQGNINSAIDEYTASFNLSGLSFQTSDAGLSLEEISGHADGYKVNELLWLGKGSTKLGHINFSEPVKNISFLLNNITSEYNLDKENETALTMYLSAKVSDFTSQAIGLKNIIVDMNINHINLEAITDYAKSIQDSYQNLDGETPTAEQTAANIQNIAARTGEKILKSSPELIINKLDFLMNDGFYKSKGKLSFDGTELENISQLSDPVALNKRLTITSHITFDTALAKAIATIGLKQQLTAGGVDMANMPPEQIDQMINVQTTTALQTFINQGYLRQDGEEYTLDLELKDGVRLINGKPLAIPGM
ncbi:MAG: YdgA family protein [Emcibacter sp.]|nr:YdgA family protein [Emcibacter sp.]